ncbi:YggS family pyridoxal phosphate-dependent enzyme [Flaviaesturariibacter amylovorans]|uniref:Pyridoxal phosphate homeostasis protein n=1 Tax=Flaviaesturariibacter amylovorans TaxID=1084520 RepID=A0ABP8GVC0_9BACT
MPINEAAYQSLKQELDEKGATLVAVSKTKPVSDILALYELGQRDFGENYVQELVEKQPQLPPDIRWHFIGHLQSNKVKYIAPFVHLIHGVDSEKLLREVGKQAVKNGRTIDVLLQMHIAREETKFGFSADELLPLVKSVGCSPIAGVRLRGLMGMASFSDDLEEVRVEFRTLATTASGIRQQDALGIAGGPGITDFDLLSMGMSGDYRVALGEGSNLVRIGSLLFGSRA